LTRSVDKWQKQVTSFARDEEEAHMSLRWSPHRTPRAPAACAGLALGTVLVLAGCSGGGQVDTSQSPSTAPASVGSQTPSPSPTADTRAQVLAQYTAFWAHVPEASSAPSARRRLIMRPFAVDPELTSLLRGMTAQDRRGQFIYGRNVPRPNIQTLSTAQGLAVISDCQDSSHSGVERRSDHKKLTVGVSRNPVIATMHRAPDGEWRVAFVTYPKTSC
jgi:hypothetical protein